jgi:hypothetical protein
LRVPIGNALHLRLFHFIAITANIATDPRIASEMVTRPSVGHVAGQSRQ